MITKKYYKLIRVSYEDLNYLTLTNMSDVTGEFSVGKHDYPVNTNLEYSINGVDWVTYDLTTLPNIEVPTGGNIYLRGNNENGFNRQSGYTYYYHFDMNVDYKVSGNLFSLRNTNPSVFSTYTSVLEEEFKYLFYESTHLIDASGLITTQITSVNSRGFENVFALCSALTTAPDFSSITSVTNGFDYAMYSCTHLTNVTAPNISTWDTSDFNSWLAASGTGATGTKIFNAPTGLEIPTGISGIPTGWTRVDY